MARLGTGGKARRRIRATLVAGAAGALIGGALRVSRARARRKHAAGERAFSKASAGMWPPVPPAPIRPVHIVADRATIAPDDTVEQTSA
ncbi:MAG: hypothetical protein JWO62_3197 [Acidimicrobiaceae bacterium]|jgi:hypothetical protein|nr:hypothetical protein [Acidimicrobiaceae bacterium]